MPKKKRAIVKSIKPNNVFYGYVRTYRRGPLKNGPSIETQKMTIKEWALNRKVDLYDIIEETDTVECAVTERSRLLRLVESLESGETIITMTLAHLTILGRDHVDIVSFLEEKSCFLKFVNGHFDIKNDHDRFFGLIESARHTLLYEEDPAFHDKWPSRKIPVAKILDIYAHATLINRTCDPYDHEELFRILIEFNQNPVSKTGVLRLDPEFQKSLSRMENSSSISRLFSKQSKSECRTSQVGSDSEPTHSRRTGCHVYLRELMDLRMGMILPIKYQKTRIDEYISLCDKTLLSFHIDACASDTTLADQDGLKTLLECIKPGDTIVVLDFHYISFNCGDLNRLITYIYSKGCTIHSVSNPISTPVLSETLISCMVTHWQNYINQYRLANSMDDISDDSD